MLGSRIFNSALLDGYTVLHCNRGVLVPPIVLFRTRPHESITFRILPSNFVRFSISCVHPSLIEEFFHTLVDVFMNFVLTLQYNIQHNQIRLRDLFFPSNGDLPKIYALQPLLRLTPMLSDLFFNREGRF